MTEHLPSMSRPTFSATEEFSAVVAHAFNWGTWEAAAVLGYLVYLVRLCLKNSKWYTINISPIYIKQPVVLSEFIKTYLLLLSKLKPVHSLHRDFFYAWDSPCRGSFSRESDSRESVSIL